MKKLKHSKTGRASRIAHQRLVSLRRIWKARIHDLNSTRWSFNDAVCRKARADKAEGIQECIIGLNYLMKHGRAG